ncbi:zinc finger protein SHOOT GRAVITROPISM 5 [Elaeis guineensis]|uniref:Zinc finger protein SHOOT GRAVITROPISM 5 n=1 Tax=Elaeis guineensis var. tenera TaxID=51953 RepID=A0A6I9QY82_ELAGV|nr:zinc finger protein SHOOT GRAVITROPISM 5 [Elaeis guineensis]
MLDPPSPAPPQPLSINTSSIPPEPFPPLCNVNTTKKKRRPAGTPDPDAEVVSLSPRTLLESDRYVCEICNQGFQRDQNLQMHRRRHKVPWKLLKREATEVRKRVFVCPESSCLHHDPCHALGDLVGIKKHFRRKHSNHRQWVCAKCSKAYAVQSDYKAHLKTCGTRGHSCDCGRVFSRVESFIEHQDACNAGRARAELQTLQPACLSRTASSPSRSSDTNFSQAGWPGLPMPNLATIFLHNDQIPSPQSDHRRTHHTELQLLPPSNTKSTSLPSPILSPTSHEAHATKLQLSIGPGGDRAPPEEPGSAAVRFKEEAREQLRLAMAEKALADEARQQAKRQIELAEQEFANAKRIRHQAQVEINRAHALREHAVKQINSTLLQITCYACKQQFHAKPIMASDENSLVASYMSSVVTEGEEENDDQNQLQKISST